MRAVLILCLLTLTACGADGPPVKPAEDAAISVTGDVTLGVSTRIN
jgi:predicted small lipoprotein YifL